MSKIEFLIIIISKYHEAHTCFTTPASSTTMAAQFNHEDELATTAQMVAEVLALNTDNMDSPPTGDALEATTSEDYTGPWEVKQPKTDAQAQAEKRELREKARTPEQRTIDAAAQLRVPLETFIAMMIVHGARGTLQSTLKHVCDLLVTRTGYITSIFPSVNEREATELAMKSVELEEIRQEARRIYDNGTKVYNDVEDAFEGQGEDVFVHGGVSDIGFIRRFANFFSSLRGFDIVPDLDESGKVLGHRVAPLGKFTRESFAAGFAYAFHYVKADMGLYTRYQEQTLRFSQFICCKDLEGGVYHVIEFPARLFFESRKFLLLKPSEKVFKEFLVKGLGLTPDDSMWSKTLEKFGYSVEKQATSPTEVLTARPPASPRTPAKASQSQPGSYTHVAKKEEEFPALPSPKASPLSKEAKVFAPDPLGDPHEYDMDVLGVNEERDWMRARYVEQLGYNQVLRDELEQLKARYHADIELAKLQAFNEGREAGKQELKEALALAKGLLA